MLKFRAIDKRENFKIIFTLQELSEPEPLFSIRELLKPWLSEGNMPDQYIGIEDIIKDEIYTGDILRKEDGRTCLVIPFHSPSYSGFDLKVINGTGSPPPQYSLWRDWQIIGNIHENPELIK